MPGAIVSRARPALCLMHNSSHFSIFDPGVFMYWLRAIFSALQTMNRIGQQVPLPRPDPPVCVIGDVHGRLDLLEQLLAQIAEQPEYARARIIFVGDLIDRGPDSAGVLARVYALQHAEPERVFCLMGNHERMLLDFLHEPIIHGPRWIAAGGSETLTSLGLSPWTRRDSTETMAELAKDLRTALTDDFVNWLTTLPLIWREDGLAVSHAGADPAQPLDVQPEKRLLWGAQAPEARLRTDGVWVAHGHTVVTTANAHMQRITVDTGAWRSGRLSAAWIDKNGVSFIEAFKQE